MTPLTASVLERAEHCPASCALPAARSTSPQADRGTWIHRYLETGSLDGIPAEYHTICKSIRLDKMPWHGNPVIIREASFAWDVVSRSVAFLGKVHGRGYTTAPTEIPLTLDVAWLDGTIAKVADYKTGEMPVHAERNPQLELAALCHARYLGVEEAETMIIQIDEWGEFRVDIAYLDAWDLQDVEERMMRIHSRVQETRRKVAAGQMPDVSQGSWCRYCPSTPHCPAQQALVRAAFDGKVDLFSSVAAMSPDQLVAGWERLKNLEGLLETVKSGLKNRIVDMGGAVAGDGSKVYPVVMSRRSVRVDRAMRVLADHGIHGGSIIKQSMTLESIREASGSKWEVVLDALETAGAITAGEETVSIRMGKAKRKAA